MAPNSQVEIKLTGIGASPGICIGKAYLVDREGVDLIEQYFIKASDLKAEVNRFRCAVNKAREELDALIENTPDDFQQQAYILKSLKALLKDKMLYGKTIETIEKERVNAEWALKKTVAQIKTRFSDISDPYLRERANDITHLSDRIVLNLVGVEPVNIGDIYKRVILVAHDLSPAQTSQIRLNRIKGFVTNRGGKTSHTGIIARALEIPAVLGLDDATKTINNDDMIIIDGTTGVVIVNPDEKTLFQFEERRSRFENFKTALLDDSHLLAETIDGFRMPVLGNIELPEEIPILKKYGADGIGLYRTEFQYLSRTDFPSEQELFEKYKEVVQAVAPKPVTIRTLDINGDKTVGYVSDYEENNPALGLRGIRYCLQNTGVFKTQLRAILRAAAHGYVRIIFPMISCRSEIRQARQIVHEVAVDLEKEGLPFNRDIEVGILIEVPSAVVMADILADECDFFSIGTNDLIQYAFAIDREHKKVLHLYDPLHPAVIRLIAQVVSAAEKKGVKVFICGEMAGTPLYVPLLLGLGLDELSMNPQAIPAVKHLIRALKVEDTRRLVKKIAGLSDAAEVAAAITETYGELLANAPQTFK
jgi:phosphoenolpyruvate-protein phosphotransferase (PTS system enzyme I)